MTEEIPALPPHHSFSWLGSYNHSDLLIQLKENLVRNLQGPDIETNNIFDESLVSSVPLSCIKITILQTPCESKIEHFARSYKASGRAVKIADNPNCSVTIYKQKTHTIQTLKKLLPGLQVNYFQAKYK